MPAYTIKTGDMTRRVVTPHEASAAWLAAYFMESFQPERPGVLIQIKGGQYRAKEDKDMYIATEAVLRYIGRMPGYKDDAL